MKKLTNILLALLVMAMMVGTLAACGESEEEKIAALAGTWTMVLDDTEEQALALLENVDLYDEEIACVDLTSLQYVKIVSFAETKDYYYALDAEGTKACVREFYVGVFEALYENRASLNDTYSQDFSAMSEEEFYQFYADMYNFTDYAALMDAFAENAYDYEVLAEKMEIGTFRIKGEDILCTIEGESEAEAMGYKLEGDTLTLTYIDGTEVYDRVN